MAKTLLGLLFALVQGLAQAPYEMPEAAFGQAYHFEIPASNPNQIKLVFKKMAGDIAPGLHLEDSGLLAGTPTDAGAYRFTIGVLWRDTELARHEYSLRVAPPKVQLLDPKAAGVKLLPTSAPPGQAPDRARPPKNTDCCRDGTPSAARSSGSPLVLDQPLTTADDTIEGLCGTKDDVTIKRRGLAVAPKATPDSSGHFSYIVPSGAPLIPGELIEACITPAGTAEVCSEAATVRPVKRFGEQTRAVLGFQQAGASGANSDQKFFFDFYISRPLPFGNQGDENLDPLTRWWGNVRVASAPRQISSPVSTQAVSSGLKGLKINELAESAEFLSGLDFRIGQICCAFWSQSRVSRERFVLSFLLGGGATGPLNAGISTGNPIFQVDKSSPDYPRLVQAYPQAANFPYISFIPPSRSQYFREYFGGFRLTTRYADRYGTPSTGPPAMVSFTLGQNELVTGGHLRGVVDRVEAFFPLSTGRSDMLSAIYLFGNAQLHLNRPQNIQPFNLVDAATVTNLMPNPAPSNTVYIVNPSYRDIYSIGLGLDLVKILNSVSITVKTGAKTSGQ